MKKFKKLIPALCMLLVSAVMLGSTTFAWFSMNNKVTATGMQVTAKANTQFLVISDTTTFAQDVEKNLALDANAGIKPTTGTLTYSNNVYPVRYNSGTTAITADEQTINDGEWYTAFSPDYNAATGASNAVIGAEKLNESYSRENTNDLNNYALKYTGYIGLANGSAANTGKFNVKATFTGGNGNATCALVILKQNGADTTERFAFDNISGKRNAEITGESDFTVNTDTTDTKYVEIVVYVYVDGNDSSIKSNGFTAAQGNVSIEFTMTGIS